MCWVVEYLLNAMSGQVPSKRNVGLSGDLAKKQAADKGVVNIENKSDR